MQTNYIIHAKNTEHLQTLPDASVDLIYADPPFNTGHDFNAEQGGYSDKPSHSNQASLLYPPFDFSWLQDVATPTQQAYFDQMIHVLFAIHRVLKPTGALYWHIDDKTSAWYRLILNQIFGQNNYRNEIIWTYNTTANTIRHQFKNNHDSILFYAKPEHQFIPQFHPLTHKEIRDKFPYIDGKGKRYRLKGVVADGSIAIGGMHGKRIYADDNQGARIGSCWTDIPIASTKERTGYPTQKPLYLLKRIIQASSQEDDIILDPFCGSGTTLQAAQELKRRWIGIDQNEEAVEISKRRMQC